MSESMTKKYKVLYVEDEVVFADIYTKRFKALGYESAILTNADGDFVNTIANIKPDLIIMDIDFKQYIRNGAEAAEILQVDARTKSIPILFLTNAENPDQVKIAKQVPSLGVLDKSVFLPSEVISKVEILYSNFLKKRNSK